MSVRNYAPELIELFRVASQQEVRITLKDKAAALRLRFRMHNLRRDMRKEQHPLLPFAELSQLSIEKSTLIVAPADGDFVGALRDAGINVNIDLSPTRDEEGNLPTPEAAQNVASAVSKFLNEKE